MSTKHRRTNLLLAATASLIAALAPVATSEAKPPDPAVARAATAPFHQLSTAQAAGYGLFTDAKGIACIDKPGVGTMGIHYVKGSLVGDGDVNAATPEALVYEPQRNGQMRLVAV